MKLGRFVQMENISERVWDFPAFRKSWRHIQIVAARKQIVEDQVVDALRLRIDPHPRIQIRRTRLNQHDQRIGIGFDWSKIEQGRERTIRRGPRQVQR